MPLANLWGGEAASDDAPRNDATASNAPSRGVGRGPLARLRAAHSGLRQRAAAFQDRVRQAAGNSAERFLKIAFGTDA
eukprot:10506247-Alexandrium_andersonii.AAC.1